MFRPTNKLIVLLTVANFAFLALGNVLVHRVVGQSDCGCIAHQHGNGETTSEHSDCGCIEPLREEILVSHSSENDALDTHQCLLCQFFEQRIQQVDDFELTLFAESVVEIIPADIRVLPSDLVLSYPARGPPAA